MKNLAFFLGSASLIGCIGAYAAVPTGAAPFQVMIPNLPSGLEITLEGLLLQPTNSDLGYVPDAFLTSINPNTISMPAVDPGYNFGFRVGLGYVFPNSGNDVQLNWTHFYSNTNDTTTNNLESQPIVTFVPAINESTTVTSNTNFTYDAIDLDVGQYLSIGTRLSARFFTGLRFAQLQNDEDFNGTGTVLPPGVVSSSNVPDITTVSSMTSKFTGFGPRLGVETHYRVAHHFGVISQIAAALLVGRVESSSTFNPTFALFNNAFPSSLDVTVNAPNTTRIVPAFDAKLGVDYSIPFRNNTSRFSVELGYQVTQYIDALDKVHITTAGQVVTAANNSIALNSYNTTTSSVGFNGPYLSIHFKI